MKCIVDAQLPKSLSELLVTLGADSIHTLNLPEQNRTSDDRIIEIADEENRVVITKDNDFLRSHFLQKAPGKLLLVNTGNISNALLHHLFQKNYGLLSKIFQTEKLVELTNDDLIVHNQ